MTREEIRTLVLRTFARIAPEADLATLDPKADVREALDVDSMDLNQFVLAIHDALGVDIPERELPKFFTVDGAVRELEARLSKEK
ncbi:MAG TPA: acyl carrier protein [Polyangiaceae bacterium]|nr:acyl carrier protein [Polyangiaceae bacterium]